MAEFKKREKKDNAEGGAGRGQGQGQVFFRRSRTCPFSEEGAPVIDYKDVRLLGKFVSERGKILPRRITSVSAIKQRELAAAIKRSRFLALMPYSDN
jgi:small subunit ribosomal protein S18